MIYSYAAVFSRAADGYNVFARIPDIKGCIATGSDLQDAILNITETLTDFLLVYEDDNMPIPEPTEEDYIECAESDIVLQITVDTDDYRAWLEKRRISPLLELKQALIYQSFGASNEFVLADKVEW